MLLEQAVGVDRPCRPSNVRCRVLLTFEFIITVTIQTLLISVCLQFLLCIMLYKMVLTSESVRMVAVSVAIQFKTIDQYFPVVLLIFFYVF